MFWFKFGIRKQRKSEATSEELAKHRDALVKATNRAVNASHGVKRTIDNNGFTLIIAAAMGAKHSEGGHNGY